MDRSYAARQLYRDWASQQISDEILFTSLIRIWAHTENPQNVLSQAKWLELFRATGFLSDYGAAPPSESIEVWRYKIGSRSGMSWTRSEEVARWFHDHKHRPYQPKQSVLLRSFVEPRGVLALIQKSRVPLKVVEGRIERVAGGKGEDEVVVDPSFRPDRRSSVGVGGLSRSRL